MFRYIFIFCFLSSMLHTGCKSQAGVIENTSSDETMELLLQDNYSGIEIEEVLVIRNKKSLNLFFNEINKARKPGLVVPEVDFSKNMLVVWCSGETKDENLGLFLDKKTEDSYVLSKINSKSSIKSSAVITPFFLYKFPVSNNKVMIK